MKKALMTATIIFTACALAACLFACSDGVITAFSLDKDEITINIGDKIPMSELMTVEGKGDIYYTVENSDIISVDKGVLSALQAGEGYVNVSAGDFFGRLKVTVLDEYHVNGGILDTSCVYDGTVKNVDTYGLPSGAEIKYYVDGEEFFGTDMPGVYNVTAEVFLPEKYILVSFVDTAVLTLNRAVIDPGVKFVSVKFDYDGTEKSVELEGELPKEVSVRLENNRATDAGSYRAKAVFTVDERYYEPIYSLSAVLTIEKKPYDINFSDVENRYEIYDGTDKFSRYTLSEGISAKYYVFEGESYKEIGIKKFIDSGTYRLKAVFFANEGYEKNYAVPDVREFYLYIGKADFKCELGWQGAQEGYDAVYDGTEKTVGYGDGFDSSLIGDIYDITGKKAEGVSVKFFHSGDKEKKDSLAFVDAGQYMVSAAFELISENYQKNYNPIPDKPYRFLIKKADFCSGVFLADEEGKHLEDGAKTVYDGEEHIFKVGLLDESERDKFFADVNVRYTVTTPSGQTMMFDGAKIKDAGEYVIEYSVVFRKTISGNAEDAKHMATLKKNYALPLGESVSFTVKPKEINLDSVSFDKTDFVYDGDGHAVEVSGVPEGIYLYFSNSRLVNAGKYDIEVGISVDGDDVSNYVFMFGGKGIKSFTLKATVDKGIYDGDKVKAELEEGVYSKDKTLADYKLPEFYRWADETVVPACDATEYPAIYNADSNNYYDCDTTVRLPLRRKTLDMTKISVDSRFLPYTGSKVLPTVIGTDFDCFRVEAKCDGGVEIGRYVYTDIEVFPLDGINYTVVGEKNFADVVIYVYDGDRFAYNGLNLASYKGADDIVVVQEGTKGIIYGAFNGKEVTSLTLPDSVESVYSRSLGGIVGLKEISLPFVGTEENSEVPFQNVFGNEVPETLEKVTIRGETVIYDRAFRDCKNIVSVEYKRTVTSVGKEAFYGCSSLNTAVFPDATIGGRAFYGCVGLTELAVDYFTDEEGIGDISYLFGAKSTANDYSEYALSVLNFGSGDFTSVGSYAFENLTRLTELVLPYTVTQIGYGAFKNISAEISFIDGNTKKEGNFDRITVGMYSGYKGTSINIPQMVTAIENSAFSDATELTEIRLPAGITSIGKSAFENVSAKIVFTGDKYSAVEEATFKKYAGASVELPNSVVSIGRRAFAESAIESFVLSEKISDWDIAVFEMCKQLKEVTVNIPIVPEKAFQYCSSLEKVTLNGVKEIKSMAFYGCESLKKAEFPSTIAIVGGQAFNNCPQLIELRFAGGVPTFGSNVFTDRVSIDVYTRSEYSLDFEETLRPSYPSMEFIGEND